MIKTKLNMKKMLTYNEKYHANIMDPKHLVKQVIKISLSNVEINTVFSTENMWYNIISIKRDDLVNFKNYNKFETLEVRTKHLFYH